MARKLLGLISIFTFSCYTILHILTSYPSHIRTISVRKLKPKDVVEDYFNSDHPKKIYNSPKTNGQKTPKPSLIKSNNSGISVTTILNKTTINATSNATAQTFDIKPPGIILEVHHGLGNQMFQYACSYALSKKLNTTLYLYEPKTTTTKLTTFRDAQRRDYQLQFFNIKFDKVIDSRTKFNSKDVLYLNDSQLLLGNIPQPLNKLIKHMDYCQSEQFFQPYGPEISEMFQMNILDKKPIQSWIDKIKNLGNRSVALHIRRGDYTLKSRTTWMTPTSYQKDAIDLISRKFSKENLTFFVFSDDINYAKTELKRMLRTEFVSSVNISSLEEFYLMTQCSHMIVANSTFSWWAAYLIKYLGKVIIGAKFNPDFFEHYTDPYEKDFKRFVINHLWYPKSWIVLDPYKPILM